MTILNNFLKTYTDRKYQYTVQINHKGMVIAFAMDEVRRIYYSVLDLENTQIQGKSPLDVNYWLDNPKEISFPNEIAQVGYAILPNVKMALIKKGTREEARLGTLRPEEVDPFLSTTARFTAQAPFQVLSDGKFIYLFRQAIGKEHSDMLYKKDGAGNFVLDKTQKKVPLVNETLLVDRYVLAGTELKLKMEVRYQRSRHKYNPQTSKDGLGAKDLEKKPFFEPTQELDFVRNLKDGRFSVLLLPTQIADLQRWQLFTHNSKTGLIDSFNVERSSDGLFNTKGTQLYTSPDPEYQNSVLERQPGTDSFTGEPLIPVISQSGYAESALHFDGQDDYVQLPALPENLFQSFTLETWVNCRDFNAWSRIFDFGNGAGSDNILLTNAIQNNLRLYILVGESSDYFEIGNVLEIGKWIHLAVAMDSTGNVTIYKDGSIIGEKKFHLPRSLVRNQNYLGKSNWSGDPIFNGKMDEVRIWNRCRSQSEIQAALNQRLVGDEPGLWAYYRFDEGFGDRLHDQTDNVMHASIQGATWVKSDAPIGDHPGLQRNSFSLKSGSEERQIASGLASVLYHQQELVATGYDRQEKPVKRNARVMLTVGTSSSATPDKNFIAALDFAVSREGKIAQAPDCLTLPSLHKGDATNQDLDAVSRLQEEISTLKASINQLEIEISALKASSSKIVALEAQKAGLDGDIKVLTEDLNHKKQDIFNYYCRIRFDNNSGYLEADNACNLSYQHANDRSGQYWKIGDGYSGGSKSLCPSNHLTTGYSYTWGGRVSGTQRALSSSLKLDDSPYSMSVSWQFSNYQYEYEYGVVTKLVVDVSVVDGVGTSLYRGTLTLTKTEQPTSKIAEVETAITNKKGSLTQTTEELTKLYGDRTKLQQKESQLALQKVQLENKETALELARSGIQGEVSLPMSWLHTDPCGLTVAGGLLKFAYTQDAPLLVNVATGNVALYFRGDNDQFFATYYDTNTTKAQYLLEVETGKLVATARSAEPECDRATLIISDGDTPETCTLTITNTATHLEETWQHLPRAVEQFCNILNGGASEPIFIGKLEQAIYGEAINSLTLSQKPKQTLTPGSLLSIGKQKVVVSADSQAADETIAIAPVNLNIPADVPVYLIRYDYEAWTSNNRTINALDRGSLQFIFQPSSSSGNVQNGTINDNDNTRSCQWVAESPGRALSFDGKDDYVKLGNTAKLPQFDAIGDLTLEAWVRSAQLAESCRVIHHNSPQSQYTLGIQSKTQNCLSALHLDGVDDYIQLPALPENLFQIFTIETWVYYHSFNSWSRIFDFGNGAGSDNLLLANAGSNNNLQLHIFVGGSSENLDLGNILENDKWIHLAVTMDQTGNTIVYKDGQIIGQKKLHLPRSLTRNQNYLGKSNWPSDGFLNSKIDEFRIWSTVRSQTEIQNNMNRRLSGNEPNLVGYWQFTNGIAKDYSPHGYHGTIFGQPSVVASAIQDNQIYGFVGVGNQFLKSKEAVPMAQWHHLCAVYNQSYALQFKGNSSLECDHNPTLDLDQDLTIETFLQIDVLGQRQGILTKGKLGDGTSQNVPYCLYIDTDGKIAFAFEDKQGKSYIYKSSEALRVGEFYKIAVTRQHQTEVKNQGTTEVPNVIVNQWADIRFYINQKVAGYEIYKGADLDRNSQKLEIGKTYQGLQPTYLQGVMSEIRLWNTVVDLANLAIKINGQEKGLIAWWRLEENEGNIASDSKGESHAVIIAAQWVKNPDPQGSSLTLYQNGIPVPIETFTPQNNWGEKQFTLGGIYQNTELLLEPFAGTMEEVRIWKIARTQEQIQDNLFSRIKGEKQDLIANYTFDLESETDLFDQSLMGNHLTLGVNDAKPMSVLSTAPISEDIAIIRSALAGVKTQFHDTIHSSPGVQEYSDLQYDIDGNLMGIQKRCYSYIKDGQWHLLTGYKVGNLITEWIGQVQADPQIIGYIEGAPPVPSENLTGVNVDMDPYDGTAIQLVEADSVNYIYSSSKESGFDMSMEMVARLGFSQRASGGIGFETEIADVTTLIGAKATFESSQGSMGEASVSYGYNTTKVSRLQTWGAWEKIGSELNPYVGRRYIPNNVGLALVQSDTMDVFALRLAHNNALVSYRFLPNPDIPKDWNIITFPINPTYTKQGTLDGKIGLKEDGGIQPDPHYPSAASYGQWSYFKPIEAYSMKKRIERQRQELTTYYDQYSTFQNVSFQASGSLDELPGQKMATRNLVNTYVWTADGGFFSESTDVMEATSETTTGNYSFQGMAGLSVDLNLKLGVATSFQIDALFGGHVATTKTKGRETEKSFGLEVEVDVERDIQLYANTETLKTKYHGQFDPEELAVYDAQGNPIKQPGKVDAYRFMTFYFEPTTENFEDFFGKVVDPIWLEQSSEPNAIALRQANQGEKKPSCWRVLHRVTFVSRILPEIVAQNAPPLEKAIRAANIESNWELIKKLEPFVQTKTQDFVTFSDAVRAAIATYFPELKGHEEALIQYMALYFGLNEVF